MMVLSAWKFKSLRKEVMSIEYVSTVFDTLKKNFFF